MVGNPGYRSLTSEDEVQMILDVTLDGVIIQDENHQVAFANSVAAKLFGNQIEQVCHEIVEQAEHEHPCSIHCVVDESEEAEGYCYDRDGKHFRVLVTESSDESGASRTVMAIRDITSVKELQQELEQSQKLRALGQMTLGIAHDLNNMLSAVLGRVQLLRQEPHDPHALESGLRIIEKVALDATETIKRMQHYTRSTKGAEFAPVNLGEVISDVVEITRPRWQDQAQKDDASITAYMRLGKVAPIMGNDSDLREALTNLMLNSIEAMPRGGTIRFRTFTDEDNVCASISDTGSGISDQVAQRAFEPFFSTKGEDNFGLGLGIARSIVEGHGGTMSIDSDDGVGTTITMRFPMTEGTEKAEQPVSLPEKASNANILVIDDQAMIRELFREILSRDGHTVTLASGSREGLAAFNEGRYDVVYTDLGMPEISGWEVASEIKKRQPATVVVMTTGWKIKMSDEQLKESGVDFVVTKPFQIQQLRDSVAQAMKMKANR